MYPSFLWGSCLAQPSYPMGPNLIQQLLFLSQSDLLLFTVIVLLGKSILHPSIGSFYSICLGILFLLLDISYSDPSRNAPSFSVRDSLDFFLPFFNPFLLPVTGLSLSFFAAGFSCRDLYLY